MRREEQAQPTPAKKLAFPSWLDGRTVALLGTMIAFGIFGQNGFSSLRQDMNAMRAELKGDIREVRTDLRRLEDRTRAVEVAMVGTSVRLDNLERVVADIRGLAEAARPETDAGPCEHLPQGQ